MNHKRFMFTPGAIGTLELKNRIIMTAMHLGYTYEKEKAFYIERAKGGVAAITTVMGVMPEGTYKNMLCAGAKTGKKLKDLSVAIHEHDSKLFVQLFCAGRNGAKGQMHHEDLEPIAPSCVPSKIYKYPPREMTLDDIDRTLIAFSDAARLCRDAGVDAVEVSCSAGYLLSQFLSPMTNLRKDQYGGSEAARMQFPIEVLKGIRAAVGTDYPIILRISGGDMIGGYDIRYMQEFIKKIPEGLIDAVNVTGGWHESSVPQIDAHLPKGGWAVLAGQIKQVTDLPVIACNRINDEETIEQVLHKGMADFTGCARAHLADADFVNKIKEGRPYVKCIGCNRGCIEPILKMKEVQCVMNPLTSIFDEKPLKEQQKILVIGAGPAGLMSAKILASKGHMVTVCTDMETPGGLINLAAMPPRKQDIHSLIDSLVYDLCELKVLINYSVRVNQEYLLGSQYDFVVIATGSTPIQIDLGSVQTYTADQILNGDARLWSTILKGKIAIIGGGLVGIETALFLIEKSYISGEIIHVLKEYNRDDQYGKLYTYPDLSIIEMQKTIGKELGSTRFLTKRELEEKQVKTITGAKVLAFEEGKLWYEKDEQKDSLEADTVILALGYKSNSRGLTAIMEKLNLPYTFAGDVLKVSNVKEALLSAVEATKEQ